MATSAPQDNPTPATQEDFEQIFRYPSLDKMLALHWRDFERFIAHVFTCAGYHVQDVARDFFPEGPGVDLNLYASPGATKPTARVEIKQWKQRLGLNKVKEFIGTLHIAGGIPGYLICTGGFADTAEIAAEMASKQVKLIDGERLLRYIAYIGGSRLNGTFAGRSVAPAQPLSPAWLERGDEYRLATARPPRKSHVLTVANIKGGVAKTTSALNIGLALADLHNQRVLMVDLDGQESLTRSLPPEVAAGIRRTAPPERDTISIADYLRGATSLASLVRSTRFKNVWIVPAAHDLYRLQMTGADRTQMELALAEALRTVAVWDENRQPVRPDWIILDTPAGETFFARAALTAADHILIPAYPETYGAYGVAETLRLVRTMNALTASTHQWRSRMLGCVVTRWKRGTNADATYGFLQTELANAQVKLFGTKIPFDERIETAHRGEVKGERRGLFHLSARLGPAAEAYVEIVKEIMSHAN